MGRACEREEIAWAKVNLGLNIIGVSNGYHLLDTVMLPIDLGERVYLTRTNGVQVRYTDGRTYPNDICLSAAKRYCTAHGLAGVAIEVDKRIPEGWGLGGSSADAAAVLRGVVALYGQETPDAEELKEYGADVAMQYHALPCRCGGRGERLTPIRTPRIYLAVVGGEGLHIDSGAAYRMYDKIGGESGTIADPLVPIGAIPNALERAAIEIDKRIQIAKTVLEDAGFDFVTMTGSGAAYVGGCTEYTTYQNALAHLQLPKGYRCLQALSEENECRKIH